MDAALCQAYHLAKSHGSVKNLFALFTPFVALADVFFYFMIGGSPALAVILVPVTGILLFLSIILLPVLFPLMLARFSMSSVSSADRYVISITGNVDALLSAACKIRKVEGTPLVSDGRLARRLVAGSERRYRKRMAKIENMRY